MLKVTVTACIEAPVKATWQALSALENIVDWAEAVLTAQCSSGRKYGIGTERICVLSGNIEIVEKFTHWDEGRTFTYSASGLPLIKQAENTWSVKAEGDKTLLTSVAIIELKGGLIGSMFEPLMKWMSKRLAADSLAAFKYLVEHGEPYPGKFSALPRVSAYC